LCDCRKTSVLNFGGVKRNAVLGEFEAFLDERCEFADSSALLA
jgi:hypothetical protein